MGQQSQGMVEAVAPPEDEDDLRPEANLPGWVVPDLDFATFRITLIAKVMDRLTIRQMNAAGDASLAEWRVLARLATSPDSTVGRIADLAWVDRAEVSRAAAALEQRGLTRRKPNPRDARTPLLSCTAKGLRLYRKMLADRQAFHQALMGDLTPDEREQLDALLTKVARRVVVLAKDEGGRD